MTKIYTKDGVDDLLAQKASLEDLGNETLARQGAVVELATTTALLTETVNEDRSKYAQVSGGALGVNGVPLPDSAFPATLARDSEVSGLLASKADLIDGVIPTSQIPALALVKAVPVASQAAMLALTSSQVQPGDLAVRTDGAGTFILNAADPSVIGSWLRLNAPTDVVISVNGQTGTVSLAKGDLGLGNVDNTSDVNKPISTATQTALDLKSNKLLVTTTKNGTAYTLVLADAGTVVELSHAAANTVTVDPNSSVAFPVGTVIRLRQYGAGQTTIAPGAGVTIRSLAGNLKIAGQYGEVILVKRAADEWVASGDLAA